MSYESYCNLLLSAASNYDAQFAPKSKSEHFGPKSTKKEVCTHDLHNSYDSTSDNGSYNLDSSIVELQANLHEQQCKIPGKAPWLTGHQWKSLNPDSCATWDLLPDDAKTIILSTCKVPGKCFANLHEISAYIREQHMASF